MRSEKVKAYWDLVERVKNLYGLDTRGARAFIKRGTFKAVDTEATARFQSRYRMRPTTKGMPQFIRIEPDGTEKEVSWGTTQAALHLSFYNAMVRRLEVWTGLERSEIRSFLSRQEHWKDGISPLFHGAEGE